MRTTLVLVAIAAAGCSWTEFDDLAETTWVRSTKTPVAGTRNYAKAVLGVTTSTSGGLVAVVSDDAPEFSTLLYASDGKDTAGPNPIKLGQHRIAALADSPLFVTDGNGKIAIVERSTTGGVISVVSGSVTAPTGLEFSSMANPEAVTFTGASLVVTTGK
jgi:hypothetical protein